MIGSLGLLVFALAATPTAVPGAEISCQECKFEVPSGWVSARPDREKTLAILLLEGKAGQDPDGVIKVEVGTPLRPTAMDMAKAFAGNDGKVQETPVLLDGVVGVRVEIPASGMERPRHVVVIFRSGRAFLIMCAGAKGADVRGAFEQVIRTWRWSPQYAPPARRSDNTVECNGFVVKYQPLADSVPIPTNVENVAGAWKLERAGLNFIFGIQPVPAGAKIIEDVFVRGFEEAIGAKVGKLHDYTAGDLTYREAFADWPVQPGAKVYTAHYWREGICIKVQGTCVGKDTDEGLRMLRQFLGGISVSGGGPATPVQSQSTNDSWSSHELSKTLGGYGVLLLVVAGIIGLVMRRKGKSGARPGEHD